MHHESKRRARRAVLTASPLLLVVVVGLVLATRMHSEAAAPATQPDSPRHLAVLWTSGDPDVAHRVAFMYTQGAAEQDWFDRVRVIVWGPSARLLAGDKDLQAAIAEMRTQGVTVEACIACANSYGVTEQLRALDIPVKPMGAPLTRLLKDEDWKVLTF
ncbi:MAG: DsrE family protein [bacterium]